MDPLTHALASYALKQAALPRIPRAATISIILAGTIASLDTLSAQFDPSAYLSFYRTCFHSVLAAILFAVLVTLPFLRRKSTLAETHISPLTVFLASLSAAILHLLMDLCQSAGVELFWPFSARRFALDWVAHFDLWVLGIFLAGIFLPKLGRLVTEEIGAKSKGPRGRIGASLSLAAVLLYVAVRFVLHGDAIAAMESRTYRGEPPRRVAAFAESSSPFRWHGILDTESALFEVEITVGPAASFDPLSATPSYKPEPSPALDAARDSAAARRFLQTARFPKASVEKTPEGFHVVLREFPNTHELSSGRRVQALIDTDTSGKILSQDLVWDPTSRALWWK